LSSITRERGKPIYFLLNLSGLTIFDIKFSSYAPNTDSLILGGLVSAISTFSDSMTDNISSESGTLNVIEREGMKIMFERGQEIEAILVVDKESQILMEKIRTIIDIFEYSYLNDLKNGTIQVTKFSTFRKMAQKFLLLHLDENIILKSTKNPTQIDKTIKIPTKFFSLIDTFDGNMSIKEVARKLNWPLPYCAARTAFLKELDNLKSVDISIKGTDIFRIDNTHIGILLEQGIAYQTVRRHWGDWGIKISQKIDGKHSIDFLSEEFPSKEKLKAVQLFRFLSINGYINLLTDSELIVYIFEEFLRMFRKHLVNMFGEEITYTILDLILKAELNHAKKKGRMICIAKLVDNYLNNLYFEKLEAVIKSRPEVMTPLFQNSFLPFLDHLLHNMAKIIGEGAAMKLVQMIILEIEQFYGNLVYDILFSS